MNELALMIFLGPFALSVAGFILILPLTSDNGPFSDAQGFEIMNPVWLYNHIRVNVFGAFLLALFFNLLCSWIAIGYWIYKLCTVGRK